MVNSARVSIGGLLLAVVWNSHAADLAATTTAIVDRANTARAAARRAAVSAETALTAAASRFAAYLAESGRFSHTADDRGPEARAAAARDA